MQICALVSMISEHVQDHLYNSCICSYLFAFKYPLSFCLLTRFSHSTFINGPALCPPPHLKDIFYASVTHCGAKLHACTCTSRLATSIANLSFCIYNRNSMSLPNHVPRLLCMDGEKKKPGTHCLCMHISPMISGNLVKSKSIQIITMFLASKMSVCISQGV